MNFVVNPFALKLDKILWSFGQSESNRVTLSHNYETSSVCLECTQAGQIAMEFWSV